MPPPQELIVTIDVAVDGRVGIGIVDPTQASHDEAGRAGVRTGHDAIAPAASTGERGRRCRPDRYRATAADPSILCLQGTAASPSTLPLEGHRAEF
jgi:hypothetical protein